MHGTLKNGTRKSIFKLFRREVFSGVDKCQYISPRRDCIFFKLIPRETVSPFRVTFCHIAEYEITILNLKCYQADIAVTAHSFWAATF